MPKIKPSTVRFDIENVPEESYTNSDPNSENTAPVMIYYGSQSGTAESFAHSIHKECQMSGISAEVVDLEKFNPDVFRSHKVVILVVATTGEGDATDNARKFNRYITSKTTPLEVFRGLKYAVFGLGDLNYINFNQMGKRTENNMDRLGATKIHPRGIGDASQDIEADLRKWIDVGLFDAIRDNVPNLSRTGSKPVLVLNTGLPDLLEMKYVDSMHPENGQAFGSSVISKAFWELSPGSVIAKKELRPTSSTASSTLEITVRLPPEAKYHPCDTIEILPENSDQDVEECIEFFCANSKADMLIDFETIDGSLPFPTPCTVHDALKKYMDLSCCPSKTFVNNLAVLNKQHVQVQEALHSLADNSHLVKLMSSAHISTLEFMKLFRHFFDNQFSISLSQFFQIGPKQRVRPYTGASKMNPVRLVAAVATTERQSLQCFVAELVSAGVISDPPCCAWITDIRPRYLGLASKFLTSIKDRPVLMRVRESTLRPSKSTPSTMIAICAGAGIAPFMAFLDTFKSDDKWPRSLALIFGCRNRDVDLLYRQELQELAYQGKLKLFFAFSRDRDEKAYCQDVVRSNKYIHSLLGSVDDESRILICGNTGMCRSVCETIASQIGGQLQLEQLEKRKILTVEMFG